MNIHFIESAPSTLGLSALAEAEHQFAAAEITEDVTSWMFARGGWYFLLLWAEMTYVAPYCAKLGGPCPDGCATIQLTGCGGETAGDCWRVKPPSLAASVPQQKPAAGVVAIPATVLKCMCGQPWVLNTVHRAGRPCWTAPNPVDGPGAAIAASQACSAAGRDAND